MSENSVNLPQIYEIFPLSVGKSMLPKDLGKITSYIVGKFTDIFYSVDKHEHDSRKFK